MKEQAAIARHWCLVRLLSSRPTGATVRELMDVVGVSEKTIRRDLVLLRSVGFPLSETIVARNLKRWQLDVECTLPAAIRWDEAVALYVGRKLMQPLTGTLLEESFQSVARKIELVLSDEAREYFARLAESWHIVSGPVNDYGNRSEFLDDLHRASSEQRLTWLTYQSQTSTEPVTYDVHPYGLVMKGSSVYLVAYAPQHGEVRHYKLDRISGVDVQSLKFQKPADFDLEQHFAGSWSIYRGTVTQPQTVRVRFTAEVARYVQEKRWHASQKLTPQPDGSLLAEFTLTAIEEIKAWLLSFGPKAAVLEPQSLRDEIIRDLTAALAQYAPREPTVSASTTAAIEKPKRRKAK